MCGKGNMAVVWKGQNERGGGGEGFIKRFPFFDIQIAESTPYPLDAPRHLCGTLLPHPAFSQSKVNFTFHGTLSIFEKKINLEPSFVDLL